MRDTLILPDQPRAGDGPRVSALLDRRNRLSHRCDIIKTGNDSWRLKNRA